MVIKFLRKISTAIFNQPFFYKYFRAFFLGGLPTGPLLEWLHATFEDRIVDVGCGSGYLSEEISYREYLGVDSDSKMIDIARRKKRSGVSFEEGNIVSYDFSTFKPTKGILFGVIHHLNDEQAVLMLNHLAGCVSQHVVTLDTVYIKGYAINNLLGRLDRGEYVRTEEQMDALIAKTNFTIQNKKIHFANTRIAVYLIYRLIPKLPR